MRHFVGEAILACLLIALVIPALVLPWSLIDDALYFFESHRLLLQLGLTSPITHLDLSAYAQPHNPWVVSRLIGAVEQLIAGGTVWLYHVFRLVNFLMCVALLYLIVFQISRDQRAARLGVLLFALFSPIHYSSDCQAYLANWYRLHTTDSVLVPFYLLMVFLLVQILKRSIAVRTVQGSDVRIGIAALGLLFLAVFVKQTIVAVPIAMVILCVVLVATRQKRPVCVFWGIMTAAGIVVVALGMLIMRVAITVGDVSYIEEYSFTSRQISEGFSKYLSYLIVGMGPLFYVCLGSFVYRLIKSVIQKTRLSVVQIGQLFFLALALCGLLIYTPWPHFLPRYMPIMVAPLAAFMGVEGLALWRECQLVFQQIRTSTGIWLGVGAVVLVLFLGLICLPFAGKAVCFLLLASVVVGLVAVVPRAVSWPQRLRGLLATTVAVVLFMAVGAFLLMGLMANIHFIRNYTASENVNALMVEELAAHLPARGDLFLMLPMGSELGGSTDLLLKLFHGKPEVNSAYLQPNMDEPIPAGALLLYHAEHSPVLLQGGHKLTVDQRSDVRSLLGSFISTGSAFGQTFVTGPKTDYLARIVVLLDNSYMDPSEKVMLTLWDSPEKRRTLGVSTLEGAERPGQNPDLVSFAFAEPVPVQPNNSYYFELTYQGRHGLPGRYTLFTPGDVYKHGRAYFGGAPQKLDIIFTTCAGWRKPMDVVWEERERVVTTVMEPWPRVLKRAARWGLLEPRYRLLRKAQAEYGWTIYEARESFTM